MRSASAKAGAAESATSRGRDDPLAGSLAQRRVVTVLFADLVGFTPFAEERDPEEVTHAFGTRVAPEGAPALNFAFDVTPSELVTAIVTERGVAHAPYPEALATVVGGGE